MVAVGSPTGWCLLSLCVQWSNSIIPSAFIHCTASTDDTTWTATNTGLCVWVRGEDELWMCVWVAQCRLCTYTLYLCQLGMKIGTALEASVHVGMDVCSCRWVFVSVDNIDSCNIHSPVYWFIYWFPHRLVHSFPMCRVEQSHLSIRRLHSYNQYVGLGSVCVLHVHGCGRLGCVCVCVCVCVRRHQDDDVKATRFLNDSNFWAISCGCGTFAADRLSFAHTGHTLEPAMHPIGSERRFCCRFVPVSIEAQQLLPSVGLHLSTSPFCHTPWGLLSWQLDRTAITAISGYSLPSDVGLASPPI